MSYEDTVDAYDDVLAFDKARREEKIEARIVAELEDNSVGKGDGGGGRKFHEHVNVATAGCPSTCLCTSGPDPEEYRKLMMLGKKDRVTSVAHSPEQSQPGGAPKPMWSADLFISISGLIGAGKSTLATSLGNILGLPVYYEPVQDNEYLEDFYKDMKAHAFEMQIYLLNKRFKQQQKIIWDGRGGIQDRTIYEDTIFAKMLLDGGMISEKNYRTYIELFHNMSNFMKRPNLIVHLEVTPEESYERIKNRGRECEDAVTIDYLTRLHAAYEDFINDISKVIPVVRVKYDKFYEPSEIAKHIKRGYIGMRNIKDVTF